MINTAECNTLLISAIEKALEQAKADGCWKCAFAKKEEWELPCSMCKRNCWDYWRPASGEGGELTADVIKEVDVIKDFHDYQVGWLTSHNDITLSPEEENLILNFLHDTADCYVLEVGALK